MLLKTEDETVVMVHPGGFEPPTARFVAEYSIQLSYGCIGTNCKLLFSLMNSKDPPEQQTA